MYRTMDSGLLVPARAPEAKAAIEAKAATGAGVFAMTYDTPLWSVIKSPTRDAAQAQALYHTNPWIRAAEYAIDSRLATVPWHLETPDGETVTDESPPEMRAIRDMFERPYTPAMGEPRGPHPTTRRALWWLTSRHSGLCGTSFWYLDETEALAHTPQRLLFVNVARITPATDAAGNLVGWVMDKDSRNPVPFEVDELLDFPLDPPDEGYFGIGLVESAITKAQLSRLADRHAVDTLSSGGRLSGIVSPKDSAGEITDDEKFKSLVKQFRAVTDDPNAAKRTLILRGPIDFQQTSVSPKDLDLIAIANMTRDDIAAIWGVPLSQMGVSTVAGLNSGDTKKYDEAVLWQGPIHNRLVSMKETIQYRLLDRYKLLGIELTLVIDEPTFDDDAPKYALAVQAQTLPITRDEIRAILGKDPLGPENGGNIIDMPATSLEVTNVPDTGQAKARTVPTGKMREAIQKRYVPSIQKAMRAFLDTQRAEIAGKVRARAEHIAKKPADTDAWWDGKRWDSLLRKALAPFALGIAETVTPQVKQSLRPAKADVWQSSVQRHVAEKAGERITLINQTTRDLILAALIKAIEEGKSPAQLADLFDDLPGFDEYRSELVARTETMLAYNDATLASYAELDVTLVEASDGDLDDECAERNGRVFTMEEAQGITDHPNGTLDWLPVLGSGKATPLLGSAIESSPKRTTIEYDEQGRVVAVVG